MPDAAEETPAPGEATQRGFRREGETRGGLVDEASSSVPPSSLLPSSTMPPETPRLSSMDSSSTPRSQPAALPFAALHALPAYARSSPASPAAPSPPLPSSSAFVPWAGPLMTPLIRTASPELLPHRAPPPSSSPPAGTLDSVDRTTTALLIRTTPPVLPSSSSSRRSSSSRQTPVIAVDLVEDIAISRFVAAAQRSAQPPTRSSTSPVLVTGLARGLAASADASAEAALTSSVLPPPQSTTRRAQSTHRLIDSSWGVPIVEYGGGGCGSGSVVGGGIRDEGYAARHRTSVALPSGSSAPARPVSRRVSAASEAPSVPASLPGAPLAQAQPTSTRVGPRAPPPRAAPAPVVAAATMSPASPHATSGRGASRLQELQGRLKRIRQVINSVGAAGTDHLTFSAV